MHHLQHSDERKGCLATARHKLKTAALAMLGVATLCLQGLGSVCLEILRTPASCFVAIFTSF